MITEFLNFQRGGYVTLTDPRDDPYYIHKIVDHEYESYKDANGNQWSREIFTIIPVFEKEKYEHKNDAIRVTVGEITPYWLQKGEKICRGDQVRYVTEIYYDYNNELYIVIAGKGLSYLLTEIEKEWEIKST